MDTQAREQFEELFRAHFDAVLAYATRRSDPDVAKDVAAQTFLVAWRRRADIAEPTRPWLLGVARKCLAEQRRSRGRRVNLDARLAARLRHARDSDPAESTAERDIVLRAFAQLRAADRELLMLVAWDGLTSDDAAVVLDCSPSTVAVRLSRARRRLTDELERAERPAGTDVCTPHPLEVL